MQAIGKVMDLQLLPLSTAEVAAGLKTSNFLVIDTRSSGQYCTNHIKNAESLTFSNIILRRLLKGNVVLESLIPSHDPLREKLCRGTEGARYIVVIYDSGSAAGKVRQDLAKYAEVICKARSIGDDDCKHTVHFVDGGFAAFASQFPTLCEASPANVKRARSPVSICVSASLPISFQKCPGQNRRLQTPQADDSFGPPVEILPHLVLGCEKDSANLALLRQMGITAVLNVSSNCPNHFEELFEYMTIRVEDSYQADLLSRLHSAFSFIDTVKSKGGRIFLHCHAGISRSATVCIAYIMKHLAYDLSGAYDHVKSKRPRVSPNLHFMGQLVEFQRLLQSETSSAHGHPSATPHTLPGITKPSSPGASESIVTSCTSQQPQHQETTRAVYTRPNRLSLPSVSSMPQDSATSAVSALIAADITTTVASKPPVPTGVPGPLSMSAPGSLVSLRGKKSKSLEKTSKPASLTYTTLPPLHQREDSSSSISLPCTPLSAFKSHLPTLSNSASLIHSRYSQLQLSPCRVAASTDSCWEYRCLSIVTNSV